MEIKLIIFILTTIVIHTTVSQTNDENHANNATNYTAVELGAGEVGENNETIRTKRHPALLIKARPIRLKRLPISNVYRRYPPHGHSPPPSSKYGPPQTSQNLSPPKIRYGPIKHKISGYPPNGGVEYSPPSDYLDSYSKPHASISESPSHHDLLNGYQETHLVDTNGFDSYETYKTPIHFNSNSQSSNYKYYPSHQPNIPISNNYNSDSSSSSVVISSSSSSGSKLKFPSHQPVTYNENLNSDSYSGTYYSIPSTSYGVPSNSYGESHVQQPQEHQYSSYAPQHQSQPPQGTYNYQPAPVQNSPVPTHQGQSAVSYSPPAVTYNYQPAQQTPISYKPPSNYQQSNQQGTYNFAEPPQSNNQQYQAPQQQQQQQQQQHVPPNPIYSNSVTSYNPPDNYPVQHNPSSKLQGAYNTPIPVYTTKKHHSIRATTKQTPNANKINAQTEKYDLQLDENNNSASLYDTSISSYDVPIHYNYAKDHKFQKSYPPNEMFEPTKPKKVPSPPILPNIYDQEEFNSFKKTKNELPHKLTHSEVQDFSQFFDAAIYKTHPTQKPKKRTKYSSNRPPITNLNAFVSYEEILPTTERDFDEPTTAHSINPRFRRKKLTNTPAPSYLSSSSSNIYTNHHNLDADELRDAYGQPTQIHSSIVRTDAIAKFESLKNKNRLPPIKTNDTKTKSANTPPTKYHSNYSTKPREEKYDVVSIEKSKSHSYYAGTMAPSLAANFASKRHDVVVATDKHNRNNNDDDDADDDDDTKAFNVFSSGFYVSDGAVADVSDSTESDVNSDYYDNEDDFDAAWSGNERKPTWSGGNLPKNHKFTSKDVTVQS